MGTTPHLAGELFKQAADTRFGVNAPAGLPAAAVELFNRELNKALATPHGA